jgi:DNA polymerase-4
MIIPPNPRRPEVMHVDLNSAFAMAEQQANPLLRGRPVGITNRLNDYAICIAASHEAKQYGIGLGTRQREGRLKNAQFVMLESDPDKYQHIHRKMKAIFESYSPVAYMKSVDEGIIDFRGMRSLLKDRPLEDIAQEIKERVREEVGDYMTVNIGIAQNRWLAKVAAGFNKPNGLLTIKPTEQEALFETMKLVDLPYIKRRNKLRLNDVGIYTAAEFYRAPYWVLFRQVFKGVNGHHWYLKLRGYETEVQYGIRTIGRNYVLEHQTADFLEMSLLLHKASVKVSRRLHSKGFAARGLILSLRLGSQPDEERYYKRHFGWHERQTWPYAASRSDQIYRRAMELFRRSPRDRVVAGIDLTTYGLEPLRSDQPRLFEDRSSKLERLEEAVNQVNDGYGELTVRPAAVALSRNPMKDKVPFGTVRYFDE